MKKESTLDYMVVSMVDFFDGVLAVIAAMQL